MIKLINDDCLKAMDDLIKEGIIVDAIICDPPYGTTACKWDNIIPFDDYATINGTKYNNKNDFLLHCYTVSNGNISMEEAIEIWNEKAKMGMWSRLNKLIKPSGAIVLFGSEPFSSLLRVSNLKNYKYDWVWEKEQGSNYATVKYMPFKVTENISIFASNKCTYNPQMEKGKPYKDNARTRNLEHSTKNTIKKEIVNLGTRYPRNKLFFQNDTKKGFSFHPTQKPVSLMEYLVKTYTNENETVLDFTMGSGSTGVACKNTNRKFIGIELDEHYFKIASDRINEKS